MKKIIILLFAIFFAENSQAQQIVNIRQESNGSISNTYYKDVDNLLTKYVGTWLYTNGNTTFKITFQKKTHIYNSSDITYVDFWLANTSTRKTVSRKSIPCHY